MSDISATIGLPPNETVEFFRAKGEYPISRRWWEVWQEEHARAFTVAGITDRTVLEQVRASLDDMLANGGTFEMWKAQALDDLRAAVAAGTAPPNILSDRRLRIIYATNLRMARAAGQWKRIEALKERAPFLMYSAVMDGRTRPLHRQWGGTILPVDHPWWNTHFPPCGWNCRCSTIQLSQNDLDTRGLKVADSPPDDGPPIDWLRGDGAIESVPRGIDPGFAYNVGKEHFRGLADVLTRTLEEMAPAALPAARALLQDSLDRTLFTSFLEVEGSDYPVMVLAEAERTALSSTTAIVRLSSETYAKQLARHPEIGIAEYRRLVDVGAHPELILKQGELRLIFVKAGDGRWLKATVKVTADRMRLYLVSYQFARAPELARLRRSNEVIFDAE